MIAEICFQKLDGEVGDPFTMSKIRRCNAYLKASTRKHLNQAPADEPAATGHQNPIVGIH